VFQLIFKFPGHRAQVNNQIIFYAARQLQVEIEKRKGDFLFRGIAKKFTL